MAVPPRPEPDPSPQNPAATLRLGDRIVGAAMVGLPLVAVFALLTTSLRLTSAGISDPDTFWHLRAGKDLVSDWRFVRPDTGSSFTDATWVLHEWAPEALMALAYRVGGLAGVAWVWELGLVALVMAVVTVTSRRSRPLAAAVASVLGMTGTLGGLSPRPQLVTFLLVTVTVGAWISTTADQRPRWWLVPLTWVWACSHGMWFFGPGIGVVVVLGMVVDSRRTSARLTRAAFWRLVAVPVLSVLVALATPVGPRLVLSPFAVAGYTRFVSEWAPSRLGSPPYAATLAMLAIVVVGWGRRDRAVPATRILLWLLSLLLTVLYARTVAVAAVVAAPLLAEVIHDVLPERRAVSRRVLLGVTAGMAGVALLVGTATVSGRTPTVPTGLSPQLDALPAQTVVFDEYDLGGWLFWAHPDLRPVIDGRTELFSIAHVQETFDALDARPGWQESVARSRASAALLRSDSPLGDGLLHQLGWRVVATDGDVRLLVAPSTSS